MKRILLTISLALALALSAAAGTLTARQAFLLVPDSLLDLLPVTTRSVMAEKYRPDSTIYVRNALGGRSAVEAMDSTYIRVRLTAVSTMQLKVLPGRKDDSIIGMAYTISGPEADSELFFFDSNMQPMRTSAIVKALTMKDFFNGSGKQLREVEDAIPFPCVEYSFSPADTGLTATLTNIGMVPREQRAAIEALSRGPLHLDWRPARYTPARPK